MNKARDIRNIALGVVLTASGLSALAAINLTTFTPNTPIKSSEVNANFSSLKASIEALETAGSAGYSAGNGLQLTDKTFSVVYPLRLSGGSDDPMIDIFNPTGKVAISGQSLDATGVYGQTGTVSFYTRTPAGVLGYSVDTTGVYGYTMKGIGVFGGSNGTGVGIGVKGDGNNIGVQAWGSNVGLDAFSQNGNAVVGRSGRANAAYFYGGSGGIGVCSYNGGAGWNCTSDRNKKENFKAVNSQAVLEQLAKLPITRWNMKGDRQKTPHMGPVAQDFKVAFGLGDGNTTINTADAQGVALAAIKGVYEKNLVLEQQVKTLEARLKVLEKALLAR